MYLLLRLARLQCRQGKRRRKRGVKVTRNTRVGTESSSENREEYSGSIVYFKTLQTCIYIVVRVS